VREKSGGSPDKRLIGWFRDNERGEERKKQNPCWRKKAIRVGAEKTKARTSSQSVSFLGGGGGDTLKR